MYVEMKNIFKQYGNFRASDNVNFGIEKGKLVALLGPSGSGKTTILRMIAGLETPSFGDIYIDGKRVNDVPANQREIGFVFQNYALFRHMTVYDNIAFGLKLKKVPKDEIKKRVTELLVIPSLVTILRSHVLSSVLTFASIAANGSSNRSTDGLGANALAKATLCLCPPDNWLGYLFSRPASPVISRSSVTCLPRLREPE